MKKTRFSIFLALALLSLVSACGESVKSIDYFYAHPDEMRAMQKKCNDFDMAKWDADQNCQHAMSAEGRRINNGKGF